MVFQAAKRLATLNAAHEGLVFGRLDLGDAAEGPRYIGRIGLRDDNRDSMLVDWRAPRRRCSTRRPRPTPRASYGAGCCAAPPTRSSPSRTTCSTPSAARTSSWSARAP